MKPLRTLIVEDEPLARDIIILLLKKRDDVIVLDSVNNGLDAITKIETLKPDLIFLDIEIPHFNGIQVFDNLTHKPLVIFTTAYEKFAVNAFNIHAVDYLLKPFTDHRFYEALDIAIHNYMYSRTKDISEVNSTKSFLKIDTNRAIVKIPFEEIIAIIASGNYIEIITKNKKYLQYNSIKNILKKLPSDVFIQIHRSHIISKHHVLSAEKHINGEYYINLTNQVRVKLSRSFKNAINLL